MVTAAVVTVVIVTTVLAEQQANVSAATALSAVRRPPALLPPASRAVAARLPSAKRRSSGTMLHGSLKPSRCHFSMLVEVVGRKGERVYYGRRNHALCDQIWTCTSGFKKTPLLGGATFTTSRDTNLLRRRSPGPPLTPATARLGSGGLKAVMFLMKSRRFRIQLPVRHGP